VYYQPATPKIEERTFVGSLRRIRVVAIVSSRSVNQPFFRYQAFVWVGEGGILKNVAIPIESKSTFDQEQLSQETPRKIRIQDREFAPVSCQPHRQLAANWLFLEFRAFEEHQLRGNFRKCCIILTAPRRWQARMEVPALCRSIVQSLHLNQ
jgi:hypothetical protein